MIRFVKKDDGLVTIEWVGIAAVMVLAAVAVAAFVMQGADSAGGTVVEKLNDIPNGIGTFGDGSSGGSNPNPNPNPNP